VGSPPPVIDSHVSVEVVSTFASAGYSRIDLVLADTFAGRTQTYCLSVESSPLMVTPGTVTVTPPPVILSCQPGDWLCALR
jgi:hypothetical protein